MTTIELDDTTTTIAQHAATTRGVDVATWITSLIDRNTPTDPVDFPFDDCGFPTTPVG